MLTSFHHSAITISTTNNSTIETTTTTTKNNIISSSLEMDMHKVLHHQITSNPTTSTATSIIINRELKKMFQKWWGDITSIVVQNCNTILSQLSSASEVTDDHLIDT